MSVENRKKDNNKKNRIDKTRDKEIYIRKRNFLSAWVECLYFHLQIYTIYILE